MGATEDGARGRAARPGGTDCFPPNPPSILQALTNARLREAIGWVQVVFGISS